MTANEMMKTTLVLIGYFGFLATAIFSTVA